MHFPNSLLHTLQQSAFFDEAAFLQAHTLPPSISVRINPRKLFYETIGLSRVPWSVYGYYLPSRPEFVMDPLWHGGAYYVQEASSMFLEQAVSQHCDVNHALRVLDLCAAPGGKSTHLASLLSNESLIISNEVIAPRATILVENITKWGYANNWVSQNDPKEWGRLKDFFDVMIIDAPCSGSGLFRKDEKAIDEWSEKNVKLCSERQKRILHDALPCLKPGGMIVYMTCSYSPEENEEMADYITEHFHLQNLRINLQEEWHIIETESDRYKAKGYRFFPDKLKGEGFFLTCFRKPEEQIYPERTKVLKPVAVTASYQHWVKPNDFYAIEQNKNVFLLHQSHVLAYEFFKQKVKIIKKGIHVGEQNFKDFTPSHELCMSGLFNDSVQLAAVDKREALYYLGKKDFHFDCAEKGWQIVTYQNCPLGWIKHLGNRINNYYPTNWRIRKHIDL